MRKMKRPARYFLLVPEGIIRYGSEVTDEGWLDVYVDSDWAGCRTSRKSTSGGMLCWAGGLLKSWARTQGTTAMSSGEAEFYAGIKGAAEGLGMQSLLKDLGCEVQVRLHQDSTAARGVNSRIGIG